MCACKVPTEEALVCIITVETASSVEPNSHSRIRFNISPSRVRLVSKRTLLAEAVFATSPRPALKRRRQA